MPTTSIACPSRMASTGIFAPGWPIRTRRAAPTTISARHRSPSLRTSSMRPETVTRRQVCAAVSCPLTRRGAGAAPAPSRSIDVARRRGAPYAVPTRPTARIRVPTPGAVASFARRTSIAPVASWTTIRRPVASRRDPGAVTMASIATSRSVIPRALATETARVSAGALAEGRGVGAPVCFGVGAGEGDGEADGAATSCTSAGSRSQTRYPSSAPLCEARWPAMPVSR